MALLVCTWRHGVHVGGQEQKHFFPVGKKKFYCTDPNMAALSPGWKPISLVLNVHRATLEYGTAVISAQGTILATSFF